MGLSDSQAERPTLWLLLAQAADPATPYAAATLAWMAPLAGAEFDAYVEDRRDGALFALTGSPVISGAHYAQFNLICAAYRVVVFQLGTPSLYASTIRTLQVPVAATAARALDLGRAAAALAGLPIQDGVLAGPASDLGDALAVAPYLYPEIAGRQAIGVPASELEAPEVSTKVFAAYLDGAALAKLQAAGHQVEVVDSMADGEGLAEVTERIARRWVGSAAGVGFGEPYSVMSSIPRFAREKRVALYGPTTPMDPAAVRFSAYTEETSSAAEAAAQLAIQTGNNVIVGRQTCDGDLFAWSRHGIACQITEPNRPALSSAGGLGQHWDAAPARFDAAEPTDAELRAWAEQGLIVTTLLWHSGESAHTEAMLALAEFACTNDIKMGLGVHDDRYRHSWQQWEYIAAAREAGGARGLIEPVLYSGGRGILAEYQCPPQALAEHCHIALETIRAIAGPNNTPTGYQAFCDTSLETLEPAEPAVYEAIASAGLEYVISSACPGRNRLRLCGSMAIINQTARSLATASPFVRVTTAEEVKEDAPRLGPGWLIGTLDAPVIAFAPYIWSHGRRFLELANWIAGRQDETRLRNVLPSTVARYARILAAGGYLPGEDRGL